MSGDGLQSLIKENSHIGNASLQHSDAQQTTSKKSKKKRAHRKFSSSFRSLEEVGRGDNSNIPTSSFRGKQHSVLRAIVVLLLRIIFLKNLLISRNF